MEIKKIIKKLLPYGFVISRENKQDGSRKEIQEPKVYNQNGEEKRVFFLKDSICTHSPYSFSSQNVGMTNNILWDRYNKSLPVHFYSHKDIFEENYKCRKKFALLIESEAIVPEEYDKILRETEYMNQFDGIFTHSERLLEKYSNAYFIPGSSVWYGGTTGGGKMSVYAYTKKKKNISLVSSDKAQCELHKYRLQLAEWLYDSDKVDVLGTFHGGKYVNIEESLSEYRYSIVVENFVSNCYFTEKILNCFAAMTIPIYVGAKKIDQFFNGKGIIQINPQMTEDEVLELVERCSESDYNDRIDAIKENYEKVHEYLCIEDYIYNHYKQLFED